MISITRYTICWLSIACASLASAISIYDVIELSRKGYSDEEVVRVIRSTGSAFELTAEDIPRLKNLGVSETIIRAMLVSTPPEPLDREPMAGGALAREQVPFADAAVANGVSDDYVQVEEINPPRSDSGDHAHAISSAVTRGPFSVQVVSEEAAGGHYHAYLTLSRLPILMLRDEGRYQTIRARARAAARRLEQAMSVGEGRFRALHADGAGIVVFHGADSREIPIITVNHRDAHAYDVRSERRVTPDLLTAYWTALLNDYWAITFLRRPPSRLVKLHRGDALQLLFELVNRTANDEAVDLRSAVQQLPGTIRRHLQRLARAVPDDFDILRETVGEAS